MVQNTIDWILEEDLDAVIVFNGRIDLTRGIIEGCRRAGIPFLSLERREHGVQLIPNGDCLALGEIHRISGEYRDKPLNKAQAQHAAQHAARRFLQKDLKDWRQYNLGSVDTSWPTSSKARPRVLILPSSKNEFEGHPDWLAEWDDYTVPFGLILEQLGVQPEQCVLRGHPNWAENIGRTETAESDAHYSSWAKANGIMYLGSRDRARTQDLIRDADVILVNGSSAAIEAGVLGKTIICAGHAKYERSGFVIPVTSAEDIGELEAPVRREKEDVIRQTLRGVYTSTRRIPQYVDEVRANDTLDFSYYEGGDPECLIRMLESGRIEPYDPEFAADDRAETEVVETIMKQDWETILNWGQADEPKQGLIDVDKRFGFRWVDVVRPLFPRGDR